jgi:hypothetical protein
MEPSMGVELSKSLTGQMEVESHNEKKKVE